MDDLIRLLPLLCLALCVLPLLFLGVGAWWLVRFAQRQVESISPDVQRLQARSDELSNHERDIKRRLERIIHEQSLRCGVIGFITGLGGIVTLPIALPIDYVLTTQTQVNMLRFIAQAYGHKDDTGGRLATYAVLTGSETVTRTSVNLLLNFLTRFLGKWLSKLIPFVGAFISFGVNYFFARSLGHAALRWYGRSTA